MALQIDVQANTQKAESDLKKLEMAVSSIAGTVDKTSMSFSNLMNTVKNIAMFAIGTTAIVNMSDKLTVLNARLLSVNKSAAGAMGSFKDVARTAVEAGAAIEDIGDLFIKLNRASEALGATQSEALKVTQNVALVIKQSGVGAQQASAGVMQLGQALSSGVLQGDELRSILENIPELARVISRGMDVPFAKLRALGQEGKLTSSQIFDAILKQSGAIRSNMQEMVTFASMFNNMGNAMTVWSQVLFQVLGTNNPIAVFLNNIAKGVADFGLRILRDTKTFKLEMLHSMMPVLDLIGGLQQKFLDFFDILTGFAGKTFKFDFGITDTLALITNFTTKVEGLFAWLYDKLIGHSYIPDIVNGIVEWFGKLSDAPLALINSFISSVISAFEDFSGYVGTIFDKLSNKFTSIIGLFKKDTFKDIVRDANIKVTGVTSTSAPSQNSGVGRDAALIIADRLAEVVQMADVSTSTIRNVPVQDTATIVATQLKEVAEITAANNANTVNSITSAVAASFEDTATATVTESPKATALLTSIDKKLENSTPTVQQVTLVNDTITPAVLETNTKIKEIKDTRTNNDWSKMTAAQVRAALAALPPDPNRIMIRARVGGAGDQVEEAKPYNFSDTLAAQTLAKDEELRVKRRKAKKLVVLDRIETPQLASNLATEQTSVANIANAKATTDAFGKYIITLAEIFSSSEGILSKTWSALKATGSVLYDGIINLGEATAAFVRSAAIWTKEKYEALLDKISNIPFVANQLEKLQTSDTGKKIRQVVGIQDSDGVNKVPFGIHRTEVNRPFAHDIISLFKPEDQVKATVSLGAAITVLATAVGALVSHYTGSMMPLKLAAVGGAAFTAKMLADNVDSNTLISALVATVKSMLSVLNSIKIGIFGEGIFGPISRLMDGANSAGEKALAIGQGLMEMILKVGAIAVIFSSSNREAIGPALMKFISAPTTVGGFLAKKMELSAIEKGTPLLNRIPGNTSFAGIAGIETRLKQAERAAADPAERAAAAKVYTQSLQSLTRATQANATAVSLSNPIIAQHREAMTAATARLNNPAISAAVVASAKAEVARLTPELNAVRSNADKIRAGMAESMSTAKQGTISALSAVGGFVGGYAGFAAGQAHVKDRLDLPEYSKIGYIIGGGILGQLVGATGAAVLSTMLIAALTSPMLLMAGLLAAIIFNPKEAMMIGGFLLDAIVDGMTQGANIIVQALRDWWTNKDSSGSSKKERLAALTGEPPKDISRTSVGKIGGGGGTAYLTPDAYDSQMIETMRVIKVLQNQVSAAKSNGDISFNIPAANANIETYIELLKSLNEQYKVVSQDGKSSKQYELWVLMTDNVLTKTTKSISDTFSTMGNWIDSKYQMFSALFTNNQVSVLQKDSQTEGVIKKASGGHITGPGTETSDSIPALLSNGEFVVNAKSTKKNRSLLESINSGRVAKFAEGGLVDMPLGDARNAALADLTGRATGARQINYLGNMADSKYFWWSRILNIPDPMQFEGNGLDLAYLIGMHEIGHLRDFEKRMPSDILDLIDKNTIKRDVIIQEYNRNLELQKQGVSEVDGVPLRTTLDFLASKISDVDIEKYKGLMKTVPYILNPVDEEWVATDYALQNAKWITDFSRKGLAVAQRSYLDKQTGMPPYPRTGNYIDIFKDFVDDGYLNDSYDVTKKLVLQDLSSELLGTFFASGASSSGIVPAGYATGGFIQGPGSGTSDDIPAMLSNGEFVVNAKSAKKNRALLDSINSGISFSKFSTGSPTASTPEDIKLLFKAILGTERSGPEAISEKGAVGTAQIIKKTFDGVNKEFFRGSLSFEIEADRVKAALRHVEDLSSKYNGNVTKIAAVYHGGPNALDAVGNIKPGYKEHLENGGGTKTTDYADSVLKKYALLKGNESKSDEPATIAEKVKSKIAKATALFDGIGDALMSGDLEKAASLFKTAAVTVFGKMTEGLGNMMKGDPGLFAFETTDKMAEELSKQSKSINRGEGNLGLASIDIKLPENITAEMINTMISNKSLDQINNQYNELKGSLALYNKTVDELTVKLKAQSVPTEQITEALNKEAKFRLAAEGLASAAASYKDLIEVKGSKPTINNGPNLSQFGVPGLTFDSLYQKLGEKEYKATLNLMSMKEDYNKRIENPKLPAWERTLYTNAVKDINELLEKTKEGLIDGEKGWMANLPRISAESKAAAGAVTRSFTEGLSAGLKELVKGKITFKTFMTQQIDSFTAKILESAVDGLTKQIFGSTANNMLDFVFGSVRDLGVRVGGGEPIRKTDAGSAVKLVETSSDSVVTAIDNAAGDTSMALSAAGKDIESGNGGLLATLSRLGISVKNALFDALKGVGGFFGIGLGEGESSGLGKMLDNVGGWFKNSFGFASGGPISGPGSGTSDSIPAMLSNGEFVVNANATARNKALLHAINNGNVAHFAEGGEALAAIPSIAASPAVANLSSNVGIADINKPISLLSDNINTVNQSLEEKTQMLANGINTTIEGTIKGFQTVDKTIEHLSMSIQQQQIDNAKYEADNMQIPEGGWSFGSLLGLGVSLAGIAFKGGMFGGGSQLSSIGTPQGGFTANTLDTYTNPIFSSGAPVRLHAAGGSIYGPGSGTSDSIPAMLSNGEYVVNAVAASKYRNLLENINNNSIARFADGGLVGADVLAPALGSLGNVKESNKEPITQTSVFNINITGDISRQTRSEIQKMLPEIAVGVGQVNRERGSKR
jgi:tape measure domain-containing protein